MFTASFANAEVSGEIDNILISGLVIAPDDTVRDLPSSPYANEVFLNGGAIAQNGRVVGHSAVMADPPHRRLLADARVPRRMPLAWSEFATLRQKLLKVGARVIEKAARIRIHFASACPDAALFRTLTGRLAASGP